MKSLAILFFILALENLQAQPSVNFLASCPDVKPCESDKLNELNRGRWYIVKIFSPPSPGGIENTCLVSDTLPTNSSNKFKFFVTGSSKGKINNMTGTITVDQPGVQIYDDYMDLPTPSGETKNVHVYVKVSNFFF